MQLDIVLLIKAGTFLKVTSSCPEGCIYGAQKRAMALNNTAVSKYAVFGGITWHTVKSFCCFYNKKKKKRKQRLHWDVALWIHCVLNEPAFIQRHKKYGNLKLNYNSKILFGFTTQFLQPLHRFRRPWSRGAIFNLSSKIRKHNFQPKVGLKVMMAARI